MDDPAAEPGTTVPVHHWMPDRLGPDDPVLIVLHGYRRDGQRYRDDWIPHARRLGALLLAPEFAQDAFPGPRAYEVGAMRTPDRRSFLPPARWSLGLVERLFDAARTAAGLRRPGYWLYGHSAGGQFVHRAAMLLPAARFDLAIAANAGAYTMPCAGERFPYGLDGLPAGLFCPRRAFARRLAVLAGAEDTRTDGVLLRSAEALRQGEHRLARGRSFAAAAAAEAARADLPLSWSYAEVPGAGHSNRAMAAAAAALFAAA